MKKFVAAMVLALMMVPFAGVASAYETDKLECFFYQTFRERDVTDCIV